MKVGIISDTHDNLDAIDGAVKVLNSKGVGLVIHAGDVISPFAAGRFKGLKSPLKAVYGNNDGERTGLMLTFRELGAEINDFLEFRFEGKRFGVYHGAMKGVLKDLLKGKKYDVVVCGHTHQEEIKNIDGALFINPGEACGYLTGRRSLCVLDLTTMKPETIEY